jgi:hypothetical protein|tara:strand:- start:256 stop:537 length:282 start_codon:yes stop_codon:yes gene_type:complete
MICMGPVVLPMLLSLVLLVIKWPEHTEIIIALTVIVLAVTVVCILFAIGIITEWISGKMNEQPDWMAMTVSLVIVFGIVAAYLAIVPAGCGLS